MTAFLSIVRRDVGLSFGGGGQGLAALAFFAVVICLFSFASGVDPALLKKISAGAVWIAALLAAMLTLENIWHRDFDDGTLDLFLLSALPSTTVVFSKIAAHWVVSGLPLLLAAGLAAPMLFYPPEFLVYFLVSLFLGSLYMSLLGGAGACLTLGSGRPGVLLTVLVLPLFVPMLILGLLASEAMLQGHSIKPYLLLQSALLLVALPSMPAAAAYFLKAAVRA